MTNEKRKIKYIYGEHEKLYHWRRRQRYAKVRQDSEEEQLIEYSRFIKMDGVLHFVTCHLLSQVDASFASHKRHKLE